MSRGITRCCLCLSSGVKKGDRVSVYMPMVVELVVAMLACVRIGAVHSIVVSFSERSCVTDGRLILVMSPGRHA